jgi:hypothetical protein
MANVSPAEIQLVTQIPRKTHEYCQAIRTAVASNSFRAILALMMALSVSSQDGSKHEMIAAVDPAGDRSKTCYDLY